MTIKEKILDSRECKNIILKAYGKTSIIYFKKDGEELLDLDKILDKRVLTSTQIGLEEITITYRY